MSETYFKNTGFKRILLAFKSSFNGFKLAFKHEAAFRQELLLFVPLCLYIIFSNHGVVEKLLLFIGLALVILVELLNSAIEATVDRISLEHHALSKQAKDIASSAVMLSLIVCAILWVVILTTHYF